MLHKIPNEVIASILAATTAFIGNIVWGLPPWAIFIGWAGTYLAGGPKLPETGGRGTIPYTVVGLLMLLFTVLIAYPKSWKVLMSLFGLDTEK